ncbi:hypothetical protein ABPG75_000154 [Micractinium tetrahymenae]
MPQNAAAVLAEALGRTGARALPYPPEFRRLVEQHMLDLVMDLPSLHIKTREYTHIDGRTLELLLAEGTVPMYYQGVKYNIPVAVWLSERYPLAPPFVYVVPTPDMVIKPRHTFVDASGLVNTLYITQWQYPASNLREMAQDMSMHFGEDPPLFSKPKNWGQPPPPSPSRPTPTPAPAGYPHYGLSHGPGSTAAGPAAAADEFHVHNPLAQASSNSFSSVGTSAGGSFTTAPSAAKPPPPAAGSGGFESVWAAAVAASAGQAGGLQPPPQHSQQPAKPAPPPKENPSAKLEAAFRSAAAASLNKRLHASLAALAQRAAGEAEEQLRLQATLRQRGEQLQAEVAALQAERVALDKLSQDLAASNTQLDRWLAENEHLARAADDPSQLDPDAVISAADPLSQQALEVQAQDLALEDALYALDKSLNAAAIEPDAYLKQVRAVCRRQFFIRALAPKIAAAQQEQREQARRSAPPAPLLHAQHAPQDVQRTLSAGRPVVLPQGDSWANAGIIASAGGGGGGGGDGGSSSLWYPAS